MTYNLHPIFAHFPIALLFLYSIIKIIPLRKWFPGVAWKDIERTLLLIGFLGAYAALSTGGTAARLVHPNRELTHMHSTFGRATIWIFGILLLGELAAFINAELRARGKSWGVISAILIWIERILCHPAVSVVLALVGLLALSVTGLLGGVIAYGLTADPLAPYVIHLLGINL